MRVSAAPEDLTAGIELRRSCRERNAVERCVEFFEQLVERHPRARAARYNVSLAYIDRLPGLSLLAQARLSTNSMKHASAVLARDPSDWLALYIRGLNNLYWPVWYRRMDKAIADLRRCTELTEALPADKLSSYMSLAYVALGDAYARIERIDEARDAWSRGIARHPSPQLRSRLALAPEQVAKAVESIRSRDVPIDTDVSFYAAEAGARRVAME